jgi:hypothetical protein
MSVLSKLMARLTPPADPEAEAEAQRLRDQMETVRTSNVSSWAVTNMPPTPDVTDPKR